MQVNITLKPFHHRGGEHIGIYFKNNSALNILVRSKAGSTWSQTGKCWYVPLSRESFEKLKAVLKEHAIVETGELKKYLEERKKRTASSAALAKKPLPIVVKSLPVVQLKRDDSISSVNKHVLPAMEQMLKLKAFSPSTIRTYLNEMAQLLQTIKDIPADELTPELLKRYLVYCYEKLGLKENTLHSRINALDPVGLKNNLCTFLYTF